MKIASLEFQNFRQLYGKKKIFFSTDSKQNVTVIHGENGSGKTTLLNAFKWCFYGTTDFDSKADNLLNERAIDESEAGSKIEMSVTVEFEHDDNVYTASRTALFVKITGLVYEAVGGEMFDLSWRDSSGSFNKSPNATTHINQILPEKMHSYFFFNGERIEKLAHINASDQIKSAIKNLMGLEIIERASQHLNGAVIAKLRKELKATSSSELADVIEKENVFSSKVSELRVELKQLDINQAEYLEELQLVNKSIEQNTEVSALQSQRIRFEDDIKNNQDKRKNLQRERRDFISAIGALAFSENLIAKAELILDEKRKKGELPFKVKEQFINDLLREQSCICGRSLEPGSDPFMTVQAFKSSTTSNDVENAFIETSSSIFQMKRAKKDLFDRLAKFQSEESQLSSSVHRMQGDIDQLTAKIGNRASADIASLELKRGNLQHQLTELSQKKGGSLTQLALVTTQLEEMKKNREKLDAQSQKGAVAKNRLELAEEAKRVVDALYDALANQVRDKLSEKVNETFRAIVRKPYWAEISADYTLQIYKQVGENKQIVYEKSTGENQVTSLSFVGSVINIAKERHQSGSSYFKGGVFPIVMDSPFGALDSDYREEVADYIPQLAEQVIIMASDSQWQGKVESKIKPRVGREYSLLYFTPHPKSDEHSPLVQKSEAYEYSELKEGYYGR